MPGIGRDRAVHPARPCRSGSCRGWSRTSTCRKSSLLMLVCALGGRERGAGRVPRGRGEALPVLQLRRRDGRDSLRAVEPDWSRAAAMKFPYEEFDLSGVRTYPLQSRAEQGGRGAVCQAASTKGARLGDVARIAARRCWPPGTSRRWSQAMLAARRAERGHRLGPRRARAQDRAVAGPGRPDAPRASCRRSRPTAPAIIHDFEIALAGATSEDVDATLGPGRFGMAEETGAELNRAVDGRRRRGARPRAVGGPVSRGAPAGVRGA